MAQAQDPPGLGAASLAISQFITVPAPRETMEWKVMVHLRFCILLPLSAVALLPGVIAADVVVQETEYEHEQENRILKTMARCKIESRPPRGFAATLGRTRRNAGGETYRYWRITHFHRHPYSVVRPTLWIMTARCQNPLHVVMNAEGL